MAAEASAVSSLTAEDIDQIAEGIEHFIIGIVDPDPEVAAIWQPYIEQLKAQRTQLAAVPNLTAALKALVEMYGPSSDYGHEARMAWAAGEAAIAKAEGR